MNKDKVSIMKDVWLYEMNLVIFRVVVPLCKTQLAWQQQSLPCPQLGWCLNRPMHASSKRLHHKVQNTL